MLINSAQNADATPPSTLLNGILNASLNGIIAYESVRNQAGHIVDFEATTINRVAQQILHLPDTEPGWQLLAMFPGAKERGMFDRYITVVETGEPLRFETPYQNEYIDGWYDVVVVKLNDGFVITFNDTTAQRETTQNLTERNALLDSILESSPSSIFKLTAIRSETGQVQDFRFGMMNEKAVQDITRDFGQNPIDRLLSEINPDSRQTGQFNTFVRVVETGVSVVNEHFYQKFGLWYNTSIAKNEDGIVITATDITTEKQAVFATEEQNELLASILNTSLSTIIVYECVRDSVGQIQDYKLKLANPAGIAEIQKRFNLNLNPIGRTLLKINPDARLTGQFNRYTDVVRTGKTEHTEHYYPNLNAWYDTYIAKLGDGVVITATDVSLQKQAQHTLEEQVGLTQAMLNGSINGVLLLQPVYDANQTVIDFTVLAANPAVQELTSIVPDAAIGQLMSLVYPGYKEAGFFGIYADTLQTGQRGRIESYYEDNKGLRGWFEVASVRQSNTVVVTFTNTTLFRQSEEALQRATTNLQTVIDNSQTGIFMFSPVYDDAGEVVDFRFKTINKMVAALIGQTPDAIRGDLASNWFISYRDTETFTRYKTTLATGEEQRFDTNYNVDGLDVWFDVRSVKLGDDVLVTFTNYTDLKHAQLAQEAQASLLNNVLDNSDSSIMHFKAVRDAQGEIQDFTFVTLNQAARQMLAQAGDIVPGNRMLTVLPGNIESGLFGKYKTVTETGDSLRTEIRYTLDRLDGWYDVTARKLDDGFVMTFTDTTSAKRAQHIIEQQAELLSSVLDGSINGIISFESIRDEAGTIVDFLFQTINEAACQLVGRAVEELIDSRLLSVFPGNIELGLFDKYVLTTETGEPTRTEVHYQADGLDFWLDISAQQLGDGFVVTFTDISAVKRASQLVQKSVAELQIVIDTTQTGIYLFSPVFNDAGEVVDFQFRIANKATADLVGQDSSTAPGTLLSTWFTDYFDTGLFDSYKRLYEAGGREMFDFHHDGDGTDSWFNIVAIRVDHEVLVTFSEFTALKKLQQQLESSVIDLKRSNRNLEQFAYVASHDLQEPLRKIQQFGDILQSNYGSILDDSGRDMLGRMQSAADRMRILIKDVLAYSRIATKREGTQPTDLNILIADVLSDLEIATSAQNAVVQIDTLPTIAGDASQLRQLFQNLISNALKFTKPGRRPELRLRYTVQRGRDTGLPISVADEAGQFYRLELSDNGIGFDPHQAEKIFQVFQRLHNRNEYTGTGIGLAIVQKVIENHYGYIQAEGRPGEGATFTILLPV